MALQQDGGPGPYGPPSGVISTVDAFRNRGLATPITTDVLMRIGITDALAPRVLQSLKLLDLVAEDGNPTDQLQVLRRATSEEYQERFAEIIRNAYAPIFAFVDPATATPERVRDAFRPYEPVGQQGRMVTLFLGLLEHAGLIEAAPRRQAAAQPRPGARRPSISRPTTSPRGSGGSPKESKASQGSSAELHPAIAGLLAALPSNGASWTSEQRQRFLTTFTAVLDFSVPVNDNPPAADESDEEVSDEEG